MTNTTTTTNDSLDVDDDITTLRQWQPDSKQKKKLINYFLGQFRFGKGKKTDIIDLEIDHYHFFFVSLFFLGVDNDDDDDEHDVGASHFQ